MRLQIVDLPSKFVGSAHESHPYLLVLSEIPDDLIVPSHVTTTMKAGLDDCAGVIMTPDVVHVGAATTVAEMSSIWSKVYDMQSPEEIAADVTAVVQEQRDRIKDAS